MGKVFVTKVSAESVTNFVWLLNNLDLPTEVKHICIKANLNDYRKWESAATCDPAMLESLLRALMQQWPSASIMVLENDATGVNADNIFAYLGIDEVIERCGCSFMNVGRHEWRLVDIDGLHFKQMEVPEILSKCDLFITFPKLKSHVKTKMTCGLKNQMGLFRPKRKITFHHVLDDLIVDCNLAMKPTVSIVDANLVMEGNYGPTYGSPRKLGLLVASNDVVAADSFCAKLFGFSPNSIGHIKKAAFKGLGNIKFDLVTDFAFDYDDYKLRFNPLLHFAIRKIAGGLRR